MLTCLIESRKHEHEARLAVGGSCSFSSQHCTCTYSEFGVRSTRYSSSLYTGVHILSARGTTVLVCIRRTCLVYTHVFVQVPSNSNSTTTLYWSTFYAITSILYLDQRLTVNIQICISCDYPNDYFGYA